MPSRHIPCATEMTSIDAGAFDASRLRAVHNSNEPSRHIFVGNCGPAVGITVEAVAEVFSQFGQATVDVPDESKGFVYVTFSNVDDAARAFKSSNSISFQGRTPTILWAIELKEDVKFHHLFTIRKAVM